MTMNEITFERDELSFVEELDIDGLEDFTEISGDSIVPGYDFTIPGGDDKSSEYEIYANL